MTRARHYPQYFAPHDKPLRHTDQGGGGLCYQDDQRWMVLSGRFNGWFRRPAQARPA
jgi:hypothetical protein